jgi:hypothetical protein
LEEIYIHVHGYQLQENKTRKYSTSATGLYEPNKKMLGSDLRQMTTPLYPIFRKRIDDAIEQLINKQVTPWCFLNSGRPFRVTAFDGRQIAYEGILFDGRPQLVFWSRYIEPFLEDLSISEISAAVAMATERRVNANLLLPEVNELLNAGIRKVFSQMADVDRRLRGKGLPEKVQPRPTDNEIRNMTEFVEERIRSELAMWKPKPRLEDWYDKNKFWVWVIGILIGILIAIASLCLRFF